VAFVGLAAAAPRGRSAWPLVGVALAGLSAAWSWVRVALDRRGARVGLAALAGLVLVGVALVEPPRVGVPLADVAALGALWPLVGLRPVAPDPDRPRSAWRARRAGRALGGAIAGVAARPG
jgi:hypothetical protein